MVFGRHVTLQAARLWVAQITEQARAGRHLALSAAELRAMGEPRRHRPRGAQHLEGQGPAAQVVFSGDARKRFDDPKLIGDMAEIPRCRCERGAPDDLQALRAFAAARDEDWLLPMAYAAYLCHRRAGTGGYGGAGPDAPAGDPRLSATQRAGPHRGPDHRRVLARADEASDLARAASLFARGGGDNVSDLKALAGTTNRDPRPPAIHRRPSSRGVPSRVGRVRRRERRVVEKTLGQQTRLAIFRREELRPEMRGRQTVGIGDEARSSVPQRTWGLHTTSHSASGPGPARQDYAAPARCPDTDGPIGVAPRKGLRHDATRTSGGVDEDRDGGRSAPGREVVSITDAPA